MPTAEPATDETYAVVNAGPSLLSFKRQSPATSPTNFDTLVFRAVFDREVQNVDVADFLVNGPTSASVSAVSAAGNTQYDITVSGGNLPNLNDTVGIGLASTQNITDLVGNPLPTAEPATDETFVLDNTGPTLTSFMRQSPDQSPTNANTLVFRATFSEVMANVDAADFNVSGTTATISSVSLVSVGTYDFTISGGNLASLNGTVGINLASNQNMTDLAGNQLPTIEPTTDETFLVDNTVPTLTAFTRQTPLTSPTNADVLVFRATFSEAMTNVDAADFSVTGTTATISNVSPVAVGTYDITVSGGNLTDLNGTVGIDVASAQNITDRAENPLPTAEPATDETYAVVNAGPTLLSFKRQAPQASSTNSDTLVFRAVFDREVQNVGVADFLVNGPTSATVSAVSAAGNTQYDITVSGGDLASMNGTVGVDLAATQNITDLFGNPLGSSEPATDETYAVDNRPPKLDSFTRKIPDTSLTNVDVLIFRAAFSETVTTVDDFDFMVTGTTATVTRVSLVSSGTYDITVSGGDLASVNATVGIDLASSQVIRDLSGNRVPTIEPVTDETYTIDNTAPSLSSFMRQSPATSPTNADVLNFRASFNEALTNVDDTDFGVSGTTAAIVNVSPVTVGVYDITIAGGDLASLNGTVGINLASGQNITDLAGNPLPTAEPATDETYTIDNDGPAVDIVDVTPDPRSTAISSITIRFTEEVSGFDISDLALVRSDSGNLLTNAQSLQSIDSLSWTLENLEPLTDSAGAYKLTLSATDSLIKDGAGNDLLTDASDAWQTQPEVTLSLEGSPMNEAGGVATVTAELSLESNQEVSILLAFTGTAQSSDYSASGTSITIPPGSRTGAVTLTAVLDNFAEVDETIVVDIAAVSNGVELDMQRVTAIITDNSQFLVVNPTEIRVREGQSETFAVSLGRVPTGDVSVTTNRTSGDGDLTIVSGASLTFTTANWSTPQFVTLFAQEDDDSVDGTATFTVSAVGIASIDVRAIESDNDLITRVIRLQPGAADGEDTFVSRGGNGPQNRADDNFGDQKELSIGQIGASGEVTRSLIRFSQLPTLEQGEHVLSAKLMLYSIGGHLGLESLPIEIYRVKSSSPWLEKGATWHRFDESTAWPGCDATRSMSCGGYSDEAVELESFATGDLRSVAWNTYDLAPAKVEQWLTGELPNNGVLIRSLQESSGNSQLFITSSDAPNSDRHPILELTIGRGWAEQSGTEFDDSGTAIAVDDEGNSYVSGVIDKGGASATKTEISISKYSPSGQLMWEHHLGGSGSDRALGIAVDSDRNVIVTGVFQATVDFDPGAPVVNRTSAGNYDVFLLKLDTDGKLQWVRTFGQSGGNWDYANGVAVDGDNNILVTGYFGGTLDIDPDPTRTHDLVSNGRNEIYVAKFDSNGTLVWANSFGGDQSEGGTNAIESANAVAVDTQGRVYVGGYFVGAGDFDKGNDYGDDRDKLTAVGTWDAYVAAFGIAGDFRWVRRIGGVPGNNFVSVHGISTDDAGNVYATGPFQGAGFDPGDGLSLSSNNGGFDVFLTKFDSNGTALWAQHIGGRGDDRALGIAIDPGQQVHVVGFFNLKVDFDPANDLSTILTGRDQGLTGSGDGFLWTLDASGNLVDARQFGGDGRDAATGVAVTSLGEVLLTGYFESDANLDTGTDPVHLTSSGGQNLFVAKVVAR